MKTTLRAPLAVLLLCTFAGCSKNSEYKDYSKAPGGEAHAGHNHSHGHVHTAPHGGTLVELGNHAYNVELLRDPATGKLTAWILDAHAENFIRIKAPSRSPASSPSKSRAPSLRKSASPCRSKALQLPGGTGILPVEWIL